MDTRQELIGYIANVAVSGRMQCSARGRGVGNGKRKLKKEGEKLRYNQPLQGYRGGKKVKWSRVIWYRK